MVGETTCAQGSSPLARGLLSPGACRNPLLRIIPARAGFTKGFTMWFNYVTDHPRSRGVYLIPCHCHFSSFGSSPLARGLPGRQFLSVSVAGIIPARAGFTVPEVEHSPLEGDHPRSRGVYRNLPRPILPTHGSSPLARGLLPSSCLPPNVCRIIPARAGFTLPQGPGGRARHGSSPLARGLHANRVENLGVGRIIPARAGFTSEPSRPHRALWDHPRSRGVYPSPAMITLGTTGSSPLARGLPVSLIGAAVPGRIIPARAGFTGTYPP